MGIEERRKIKEYQDKIVPDRARELADICGSTIPYDIDWATFADDLEGLNFLDNLSFHRINMALRTICTDQLAKDAVKDGVRKISLANVKDKKDMKMAFAGGVLEMKLAYAQRTEGMFSDTDIRNLLMKHL